VGGRDGIRVAPTSDVFTAVMLVLCMVGKCITYRLHTKKSPLAYFLYVIIKDRLITSCRMFFSPKQRLNQMMDFHEILHEYYATIAQLAPLKE
jgi:hypothetical protein